MVTPEFVFSLSYSCCVMLLPSHTHTSHCPTCFLNMPDITLQGSLYCLSAWNPLTLDVYVIYMGPSHSVGLAFRRLWDI